jgi:hypothetical protein
MRRIRAIFAGFIGRSLRRGKVVVSNSLSGVSWKKHIYESHYVYNYLYFIIYLRLKREMDCNGIERHVQKLIKANSIKFYPIGEALDIKTK